MPVKKFVVLTLQYRKEGRLWTGVCRELGTATDGRSLERVKAELAELVELHLNALEDLGKREQFFAERRIRLYTDDVPLEATMPIDSDDLFQPLKLPVAA